MTPSRQKGKPVFDPAALDEDLDELWPPASGARSAAITPAGAPRVETPPIQDSPPRKASPPAPVLVPVSAVSAVPQPPVEPASPKVSPAVNRQQHPRRLTTAKTSAAPAAKRFRPPEVLLSAEVYDELYRVQIAEKKVRRGLARTMGAIVLDAIEAHAGRLATTWAVQTFSVGEGQIFERPSSVAVPRRRRHATAPRTVVLSGVTASNAALLDNLVQEWNSGTRSALVEQALRYEFAVLPQA
jgi:hypothetical protein